MISGDYFGHEEILTDKKFRQTRVKCLTRATVLQINKTDLLEQFWKSTLKKMQEKHSHLIDLDEIVADINKFQLAKKLSNNAILDATKMNPVNLHGERKVAGAGQQDIS